MNSNLNENSNELSIQELLEVKGGLSDTADPPTAPILCIGLFAKAVVCRKGASAISVPPPGEEEEEPKD